MLNRMEKHPTLPLAVITFLPKGHSTKPAILKHCSPNGIPIIVKHITSPPTKYPIAESNPPKISQMRLPKKFIATKIEEGILNGFEVLLSGKVILYFL